MAEVLALVESALRPGVTTARARCLAEEHHPRAPAPSRRSRACPAATGDGRSRHALCISIDGEVVHGIPGERTIREGSLVSVDAGAIVDGWHGDGARTFIVGERPAGGRELVDATRAAMMAGHRGRRARATASATSRRGGRGRRAGRTATASSGRSSATASAPRCTRSRRSRTTAPASRGRRARARALPRHRADVHARRTARSGSRPTAGPSRRADGALAAHFEHTIAITADGPQILTVNRVTDQRLPAMAAT